MKPKASQNAHRGSDLRDFLASESILAELEVLALKRVVFPQLQQILEQEHVTKTELASRMKTSRASLDRMLDPSNPSFERTVSNIGVMRWHRSWRDAPGLGATSACHPNDFSTSG
jgi:hypothetical protein